MDQNDVNDLAKKLPRSPNIMAKGNYFNSAVLVPLILIDGEMHFLFQKRADDIRQGTEICFPGGEFDPDTDKNLEQSAVRETFEELGIKKEQIQILGRLDTLVSVLGATVDSFVAVLAPNALDQLKINRQEVAEVFTLPVSFFKERHLETYQVRLLAQSSYTDKNGEKVTTLPSEKLGLPEIYHKSWGGAHHRVLVYKTSHGVLWGITAEIVHDVIKKL